LQNRKLTRVGGLTLVLAVVALLGMSGIASATSPPSFITTWGSNGSAPGQLYAFGGVSVDGSGNVWVADTGNNRIEEFSNSGAFLQGFGSYGFGDGLFANGPRATAVDSQGNVYVADDGGQRMQKFDSAGNFLLKWGSYGSAGGQFHDPWDVAVDSLGVYVVDNNNNRIQEFDSSGGFLTMWGSLGSGVGQFNSPYGVAVDGSGNVYVTDTFNNRIEKFDSSGAFLTAWGTTGSGNGQFSSPRSIAVDRFGNVYVADSDNNRIEEFDSSGTYLTQWGSLGSGPGQFHVPSGVAVDGAGNIYVGDYLNYRIEKFGGAPTPVPSTPPPALAPDAPTNVVAVAGDGEATVSWSAPASDGGSPIVGYTASSSGGQSKSVDGSTTTAVVGGLTDGTSYTFTVTARNIIGAGGSSDPSTSVVPVPNTPPGAGVAVTPTTDTGGPSPVNLTFGTVDTTGTTSVTVINTGEPDAPPAPPAGFAVSGVYYDVRTTATYSGTIRVCLSYPGVPAAPPTVLLHFDSSLGWVPVQDTPPDPADMAANRICGTTSSLSPFALAIWAHPVLITPSTSIAMATGSSGAVVTYSATALDSADSPLSPVCAPASGKLFPVGTTTVRCTATDKLGFRSSTSFPVVVGYGFTGFLQPLNDPAGSNPSVFKGGSTIPVKFALSYANGTPILDAAASAVATACGATILLTPASGAAGPVDEVATSTTPNSGTCFRYDASAHQFIFNLATKGLPSGAKYLLKVSIVGPDIVGPDKTLQPTHVLGIGLR
jgi:hypothetical protein